MANETERPTLEVETLTPAQLMASAADSLRDAEFKLGRLGDLMHELRHQVARDREQLEALLKAMPEVAR